MNIFLQIYVHRNKSIGDYSTPVASLTKRVVQRKIKIIDSDESADDSEEEYHTFNHLHNSDSDKENFAGKDYLWYLWYFIQYNIFYNFIYFKDIYFKIISQNYVFSLNYTVL